MNVATRLPHDPSSIAEARQAVDGLDPALDDETIATVRLLVSELVTNSVRHGVADESGHIELSLSATHNSIRVEVVDAGEGFTPRARVEGQDAASGWGLHLLEVLSHRWGTEHHRGTRIWFEIDKPPVAAGA
jgi:anti-sigma regulatory factor (Ser/Thr protein kinase)